jgi:hypothetical protein
MTKDESFLNEIGNMLRLSDRADIFLTIVVYYKK